MSTMDLNMATSQMFAESWKRNFIRSINVSNMLNSMSYDVKKHGNALMYRINHYIPAKVFYKFKGKKTLNITRPLPSPIKDPEYR